MKPVMILHRSFAQLGNNLEHPSSPYELAWVWANYYGVLAQTYHEWRIRNDVHPPLAWVWSSFKGTQTDYCLHYLNDPTIPYPIARDIAGAFVKLSAQSPKPISQDNSEIIDGFERISNSKNLFELNEAITTKELMQLSAAFAFAALVIGGVFWLPVDGSSAKKSKYVSVKVDQAPAKDSKSQRLGETKKIDMSPTGSLR